jgi:hypothetical protein
MDDGFVVDSDLDFARLNELVSEKDRGLLKINPGFLLDVIFTTRVSLTLAAHYGSELHTWELLSNLMQLRCTNLLQKVRPELAKAASFQEVAFPERRMIKEAIDSGERQFEEFVPILDRPEQFREWTHGLSADANLVHEYFAAVTADKWISSMPVKALRYVFGVQAQLADTVLAGMPGLVLSAVDALLLDRLLRGWKPNHFVDKDLKPFLGSA